MAQRNTQEGAGKLAVVTGSSSGIGFELARQFAKNGFDLAIVADEEAIQQRAVELRSFDVEVQAYQTDLARSSNVTEFFDFLLDLDRPIDVLALNAGVGVNGKFVNEISLQEDLNLIALNISSAVHLAKLVLPQMVQRHSGKVLITSSIAALMPGPYYATYAASKAFLLSFSEALFNELKDSGVTVTALMPGATDTKFFKRAHMETSKAAQSEKDDPALVAEQAYKALMHGEDHIIAGSFTNRVQGFLTHFLTEQMKAKLHRNAIEPQINKKH